MKPSNIIWQKILSAMVMTVLLLLASARVFADDTQNSVHACLHKLGAIIVVDSPEDCNDQGGVPIELTKDSAIDALQAQFDSLQKRVGTLQIQVSALTDLLKHFNRFDNDVVISGANLHVVNGTGSTSGVSNSLGNIIIGYNEPRVEGEIRRTGSHMLVVGRGLNYTSFGGIVAGWDNETNGDFSSVTGGRNNTASGGSSSVSGGNTNIASGASSTVSGGQGNEATNSFSSVSGGWLNIASGQRASVSGGRTNVASGPFSASVSGGSSNTASGPYSSVSGGSSNTASSDWASVSGGQGNTASGDYSSVSGGWTRSAQDKWDWAAGGLFEHQ